MAEDGRTKPLEDGQTKPQHTVFLPRLRISARRVGEPLLDARRRRRMGEPSLWRMGEPSLNTPSFCQGRGYLPGWAINPSMRGDGGGWANQASGGWANQASTHRISAEAEDIRRTEGGRTNPRRAVTAKDGRTKPLEDGRTKPQHAVKKTRYNTSDPNDGALKNKHRPERWIPRK